MLFKENGHSFYSKHTRCEINAVVLYESNPFTIVKYHPGRVQLVQYQAPRSGDKILHFDTLVTHGLMLVDAAPGYWLYWRKYKNKKNN